MSKGSTRRPCFVSDEELERRWAAIRQADEAAQNQAKAEQEAQDRWAAPDAPSDEQP